MCRIHSFMHRQSKWCGGGGVTDLLDALAAGRSQGHVLAALLSPSPPATSHVIIYAMNYDDIYKKILWVAAKNIILRRLLGRWAASRHCTSMRNFRICSLHCAFRFYHIEVRRWGSDSWWLQYSPAPKTIFAWLANGDRTMEMEKKKKTLTIYSP